MLGFRLKISIGNSYRTVAVPKDITFKDLHRVIQVVMEWSGYHLHEFDIKGMRQIIADPDYDMLTEIIDEDTAYLRDYADRKISYIYDFGDWWVHNLKFEGDIEMTGRSPKLLKFKGVGPQEDSGGRMRDEDDWDPKEFEVSIGFILSTIKIPQAEIDESIILPPWSLLPLSYAVFMQEGIPLFLDPVSGGVFSTEDNGAFPIVDEDCIEGMIPIEDEDRHIISEVAEDLIDNCEYIKLYERIEGLKPTGIKPQLPELDGCDSSDYYRRLPKWLFRQVVEVAMDLADEATEYMGAVVPLIHLTEGPSLERELYGYDLMPRGTRCPECFQKLSNPAPIEGADMVKHGILIMGRPLTMTCIGCGRKTEIAFAPIMSNCRYYFAERGYDTEILTGLFDSQDGSEEDVDHVNALLSITLLASLRLRPAIYYAKRVDPGANQWNDGCCVAVLGACGEIDRDEIKKRLDPIIDYEGLDPVAFCILCALNKGYALYEDRFTEKEFEYRIGGLSDYETRMTLIAASGTLRRIGCPHEAAILAQKAISYEFTMTDLLALDEYIRSSKEADETFDLGAYTNIKKNRTLNFDERAYGCICYRIGAASLLCGSIHDAESKFRGFISSIFSLYNDDARMLSRGSCAALVLHHMGVAYSKKNLISYSIKWMCSVLKSGEVDMEQFEDYLTEMLPLALSEMSENDIRKILKRNGFGDIVLPDVSGKTFDPARIVSLDAQYIQ